MKHFIYFIVLFSISICEGFSQEMDDDLSVPFDSLDEYYENIYFQYSYFEDLTIQHYGLDQVDEDTMVFATEDEREEYGHEMAEDESAYFYAERYSKNSTDDIYKLTVYEQEGYIGFPNSYETEYLYENEKLIWINAIEDIPDMGDGEFTRKQTRYYIKDGNLQVCRQRKVITTVEERYSIDTIIKKVKFKERPCDKEDKKLVMSRLNPEYEE